MRIGHMVARPNVTHGKWNATLYLRHTLILVHMLVLLAQVTRGTQLIKFQMAEEKPLGFVVGILYKQLPDEILTDHGQLMFHAIDQGYSYLFSIGHSDGRVQVVQRVDREALCPYSDIFTASSPNPSECHVTFTVNLLRQTLSTTNIVDVLRVTVIVEDINDNPCYFDPKSEQRIVLPEDVPVNSVIELHRPCDLDTGLSNGVVESSIELHIDGNTTGLHNNPVFGLRINKTNSVIKPFILGLIIHAPLDYEMQTHYTLRVRASDLHNQECHLLLDIKVLDTNDNIPRFSKHNPSIRIPETADLFTPIYTMTASDEDSDALYKMLLFDLDPAAPFLISSTFRIDLNNGSIFLRHSLNYHEHSHYSIPVIVYNPTVTQNIGKHNTNNQHLHDTTNVFVEVINVNDQPPRISVYTPDGSEQITLKEHTTSCPCDFAVVAVVDEPGAFSNGITCNLEQKHTKQFQLTKISSTEQDSIDRKITNHANYSLIEVIYKLSALQAFDREVVSVIPVRIACEDGGIPRLTAESMVNIRIGDINDNAPRFNMTKWRVEVNEDTDPHRQAINYFICQLNAVDLDDAQNAHINYQLLENGNGMMFKVNRDTGTVFSTGSLDHENSDHHQFTLLAVDEGSPKLTGTIQVDVFVKDFNDHAPVFGKQTYAFQMEENNGYGDLVGSLQAFDMDDGSNAIIQFHLESIEQSKSSASPKGNSFVAREPLPFELVSYFDSLQNTYEVRIYASRVIDREAVENTNSGRLPSSKSDKLVGYKFWIVGEDQGIPRLRGQTLIHILINDVNDHRPVFQIPSEDFVLTNVSCYEKRGHIIIKVYATDRDAGINGTVRYQIERINRHNNRTEQQLAVAKQHTRQDHGKNVNLFEIHETNGIVYLAHPLSFSDVGTTFSILLLAHDLGIPSSLSSAISLLVQVDASTPIGDVNGLQQDSFLEEIDLRRKGTENGNSLNFLIIISVLFVSFIISASLIGGLWIALKKRKTHRTRNVSQSNANGTVGVPLRSVDTVKPVKEKNEKHEQYLRTKILPKCSTHENETQNCEPAGTLNRMPPRHSPSFVKHPPCINSPQLLQVISLSPCTNPLNSGEVQPIQLICSYDEVSTSTAGATSHGFREEVLSSAEPFLYCATPIQSMAFGASAELQPSATSVQPLTMLNYTHPVEVQHLCAHSTLSKRNSVSSVDQDSGKGDSLETNIVSILPSTRSIWIPTNLPTLSYGQHQNSITLPFVHVYTPLTCLTETDTVANALSSEH